MKKFYIFLPIVIVLILTSCQATPTPLDPVSIQNTAVAIGNTAVAMAWTGVAETQIALTPPTPRPTIPPPTEDKTSFEFKVKVYRFIEERYKYYDSVEGGYSGDKYSTEIFQEASDKFGISVEFIDSFWGNTEIAQAARDGLPEASSGGSSNTSPSANTVSLYYGGVEILCGVTEQDYKDLIDTLVDNDNVGFNEMFSSGRAFMVDSGTKALVLDINFTTAKVRIMEGVYKDEIAWVGIEAVGE